MSAAAASTGARSGVEVGRRLHQHQQLEQKAARTAAEREHNRLIHAVLEKYDADQNGTLSPDEVRHMLNAYCKEIHSEDRWPSENEMEFVFKLCDTRDIRGNRCNDGVIDATELSNVLDAWKEYLGWEGRVVKLRKEFDCDQNWQLDIRESQALFDKVHGRAVPPEVTQWVLEVADLTENGALCDIELARALLALQIWEQQTRLVKDYTLGRRIRLPDHLPPPKSRACIIL